jgi:anaphase-promoting complex subunit 4
MNPAMDIDPEPSTLDLEATDAGLVLHSFPPSGAHSKPLRISVNGRKARRAICVLFADGLHYEVLDMDGRAHEEDEREQVVQQAEDQTTLEP